jgi:alkylation response protein AidB-like acyl-CoA dehydrogenase
MLLSANDDHVTLENVTRSFLQRRNVVSDARQCLNQGYKANPTLWTELATLGWLGLHIPEDSGGSGFGIMESAIVAAELGRIVAPGLYLPTVACSALLMSAPNAGSHSDHITKLGDGHLTGAVGVGGKVTIREGRATGSVGLVLGAPVADVILVPSGDALIKIRAGEQGVRVQEIPTIDPSRPIGRVWLEEVEITTESILEGSRMRAVGLMWILAAAEAAGVARACLDMTVEYAKVREQFGHQIGQFQAVKHHCANMLLGAELSAAAAWNAARCFDERRDVDWLHASAVAARVALPAAVQNAQLNIQVHGGIGFTWDHDAHLLLRRAVALDALYLSPMADDLILDAAREGRISPRRINLGAEEPSMREHARRFVASASGKSDKEIGELLIAKGLFQPHWPEPWGCAASPAKQIIIEEELRRGGIRPPMMGITGWVIATIIQHGSDVQKERWVREAMRGEIWCQLFSEPDAGSDAASIRTRGDRLEGGWMVTGQKVWTSGAHEATWGLATVRTDRAMTKHHGLTVMAIRMDGEGVSIRPLRQITGASDFNEVRLDGVFIPDGDVIGVVGGGWSVARSTLGNERVTLGSSDRLSRINLCEMGNVASGSERHGPELARILATREAASALELRRAERAVNSKESGPEGNVTKLVRAELAQDYARITLTLAGPEAIAMDCEIGRTVSFLNLNARRAAIAGGTSEITRNEIAERILGLPR